MFRKFIFAIFTNGMGKVERMKEWIVLTLDPNHDIFIKFNTKCVK